MMNRQILFFARYSFSGWHRNPRVWITFSLALVMCLMLSDQMLARAQIYNASIQVLESYIWTFGDARSVMISALLLLLLFTDLPLLGSEVPYCLIRTNRRSWLAGQYIYAAAGTVIYNFFLLAAELFLAAPWSYPGNVWSQTSASMAYGAEANAVVPVSLKAMESAAPYECAAVVFLLMLFYSMFLVSFMLFLNLSLGRGAGVIGGILLNLSGYLLTPAFLMHILDIPKSLAYRAGVLCGWLSPLSHATFSMHDFGYDYLPKIRVSVVIFLIFVTCFFLLSMRKMKKYDFLFQQTEE